MTTDFKYATWRFGLWTDLRVLTYEDIDEHVRRGAITPGMSADEVRRALNLPAPELPTVAEGEKR